MTDEPASGHVAGQVDVMFLHPFPHGDAAHPELPGGRGLVSAHLAQDPYQFVPLARLKGFGGWRAVACRRDLVRQRFAKRKIGKARAALLLRRRSCIETRPRRE
jgi:hypothetical protein